MKTEDQSIQTWGRGRSPLVRLSTGPLSLYSRKEGRRPAPVFLRSPHGGGGDSTRNPVGDCAPREGLNWPWAAESLVIV